MLRWLKSPLGIVVIVLAMAAFLFLGPFDYALRYLHFSTLTKEQLVREAEAYVRERAGGDQLACLYVVACDEEGARLEQVADVEAWDFESAKRTIWKRRTSKYCPGRTTNFALHLIPHDGAEARIDATAHARWSFFNDRFIPRHGRFQGGAFSDRTWEACTVDLAIVK